MCMEHKALANPALQIACVVASEAGKRAYQKMNRRSAIRRRRLVDNRVRDLFGAERGTREIALA
jgi:hypothetical protein